MTNIEILLYLLLTEREGRTGGYWPEVVAKTNKKRPRANIPQYASSKLSKKTITWHSGHSHFEFACFRKQKYNPDQ